MTDRLKFLFGIVVFLIAEVIQILIIAGLQIANTTLHYTMTPKTEYLISVIGVIGCGIVFFFWYRQEIAGEIRGSIGELLKVKNFSLIILLGIGCQFFVTGIMSLLENYFAKMFEGYNTQMGQLMGGDTIVVLLLLSFIAPLTEELIFRGVILHLTNRYIPFLAANIFQAVLFGLYHWNIIQGIYAGIIALLLGFVYYKFKTIFAPIFLHMIINVSAFLTYLFMDRIYVHLLFVLVGGAITFFSISRLKLSHSTVVDAEDFYESGHNNHDDYTEWFHLYKNLNK